MDRFHRVPGHLVAGGGRPRDVLVKLHHYDLKEQIMSAAWNKGPWECEGARVILLQDLAGKTLELRRSLRPIPQAVKDKGATYKWGFPFALIVRSKGRTFVLRSPAQLPDFFAYLGVTPFEMPDWYQLLCEGM